MNSRATKFRSLRKDILQYVKKNGITTLSFDVFDTLLHRRCEPDAVIDGVTHWINKHIVGEYHIEHVDALQARHRAYGEIIAQKAEEGLDLDTTIEEMLPLWIDYMVPNISKKQKDILKKKIFAKELEMEQWACYANNFSLELIKELKHKGLRIIYVSDMYLGSAIVDKLLEYNGYERLFEKGFVSGDHSLLKRTGRLFEYVISQLQLDPAKTLHIGDNYEADYIEAKKQGLHAYFIRDSSLDFKKNTNKFDYMMSKKDFGWKGYAIASYAKSSPYEIGSEVISYGKRNFGPLFSSFIHRVIERCIEENVERIYFLSREGFLLGMIYDKVVPFVKNSNSIKSSHYLYVSRLTTFLAALKRGFGLREIRSISDNLGGTVSIAKLMSPFKLDLEEVSKIAHSHGLVDINAILPYFYLFWTPFINFINDKRLHEMIEQKHLEAKEMLLALLEQEGFFDAERVAIVDVGWGGQIQENIYQAILEYEKRPDIIGFYMATNINAHTRKTPDNWMEWIISDASHLDWNGFAVFDFVQSFEAIARAPHATVIGYQWVDDKVVPILKNEEELSRKAEIEDDQKILGLMQKGIMEYVEYYIQGIQIFAANALDTIPYAKNKISTAIRFPNKHDAVFLLSLRNSSDLGMSDLFALGHQGKLVKLSISSIKEYMHKSFWKYGTAAQLWGFPMQLLFSIMNYSRHIPKANYPLAPGIVWQNKKIHFKNSIENEKVSDNHIHIDKSFISQWQKNIEIGKKSSKKVLKRKFEEPLSIKEVFYSQLAFYSVNFFLMLKRRHRFQYQGISRKKLFLRPIAGRIAHNRFFIWLYKRYQH